MRRMRTPDWYSGTEMQENLHEQQLYTSVCRVYHISVGIATPSAHEGQVHALATGTSLSGGKEERPREALW